MAKDKTGSSALKGNFFAIITSKELALPVEFTNAISAQIRWQTIRFRAMHCYPEKFNEYIKTNRSAAPQTRRGIRSGTDLLDASPVIGLVPGATEKKAISSRDRLARYAKRQGHTVSRGVLQPAEDPGVIHVKLVPVVRASPLPEDNTSIDLASIPAMLDDELYEAPEVIKKVQQKFSSPVLLEQHQNIDESSDSGNET